MCFPSSRHCIIDLSALTCNAVIVDIFDIWWWWCGGVGGNGVSGGEENGRHFLH